jgi:protein-S-isoprenylcysteine O-methyltransferase Ste14
MTNDPDLRAAVTRKFVRRTIVYLALLGALLFLSAGTLDWPGAWVYLALSAIAGGGSGLLLARHDPELLLERLGPMIQRQQKSWDKLLLSLFLVLYLGWLVLIALDAKRFHWSSMPVALQVVGAVLLCITFYAMWRVMRENSFAAPVVKVQRERGHKVVSNCPYALVRHPMYAGIIPLLIGTPLLLGSWWGLIAAPLLLILLAIRAVLEEETLKAELEGYKDYAARVRFRLFRIFGRSAPDRRFGSKRLFIFRP